MVGTRANCAVSAVTKRLIYRGVSARDQKRANLRKNESQAQIKLLSKSFRVAFGIQLQNNLIGTLYGEVKYV